MSRPGLRVDLPDASATSRFGEDLAASLAPGDVVALWGDLGTGKTTLARAAIRALAADPGLDVPSPTFTLVQSYDARIPVHHFDLYRLSAPDELEELGLAEALEGGIALIEWPERAAGSLPAETVSVSLAEAGGGRTALIEGPPEALARIGRSLAIRGFLEKAGWGTARRQFLLGDASTRAYELATMEGAPARILMNAPRRPDGPPVRGGKPYSQIAHLAESVIPFVAVDRALRERGIAAPEIHAADLDQGLLLLEHLGSEGVLDAAGRPIAERYVAAAELLAEMHVAEWPRALEAAPGIVHRVPGYDRGAMMIEVELLIDWFLPAMTGRPASKMERARFAAAWNSVFDRLARAETSIVLRDFHSPNIIWRGDREGVDRLGLIDFQDALIGPSAYDVASLALDARVTIPPDLEQAVKEAYCRAREALGPFDRAAFAEAYAIMAAQRNSKILGIFVRLDRRDGKPHYLKHLPRIRDYLDRVLTHPALRPVRDFHDRVGVGGLVA